MTQTRSNANRLTPQYMDDMQRELRDNNEAYLSTIVGIGYDEEKLRKAMNEANDTLSEISEREMFLLNEIEHNSHPDLRDIINSGIPYEAL